MADNAYEAGRLNLPFVGHCTFAKAPPVTDWDQINADVAVLGAPKWVPSGALAPVLGHAASARRPPSSRLATPAPMILKTT
jgi:hypothetical protein